jgi:hypothetical protein
MAAPLGVLVECPAAATTKVEEDMTSMVGPPWGVLSVSPAAAITEAKEDIDGGPP